jgi:hypothetical protein
MATRLAFVSVLVAVAVVAAVPAPVRAQCRLCSSPTTQVDQEDQSSDIQLEVQSSLDFDRLLLVAPGDGTATLLPDGDRHASGTIATISGRAMVGSVAIHGEAGRSVRIDLPSRIQLFTLNGGNSIAIDELQTDLPDTPRLDSAGNLNFRFGGRLTIKGDADGDYRGDLAITVEYL